MKTTSMRCAVLIAALSLLASCGGGGGGGGGSSATVCTQTANMTLYTSSTGTTLLSSITVTATRNAAVPPFPVFVGYMNPPVAAILAGYPPGSVDPRTYGMNITSVGTANPAEFSITFDSTGAPGTYNATWRFVVTDVVPTVVGCQDLPVTFTIN
jgi:hypothetical protein